MKKTTKIIILIVVIIAIIAVVLFVINNKKHNLEEYIKPEYNYFVLYSDEGNVGVVDKKGKVLIEPKYLDVFIPNPSKDVFICNTKEDTYEFLNSKGEKLFEDFDKVEAMQTSELSLDFEKNFLRFEKDGKFGLIDYTGKVIVSASYDEISSLKNRPGEILIKKNDKFGVLDYKGNVKIDCKYDSIIGDEYFTEKYGYTKAGYIVGNKTDNGFIYGYLNNYAKKMLNNEFESISRVLKYDNEDVYLIVMTNGKKGVYRNSKLIIDQKYQKINYADSSKIFVVKRNSSYGIFSELGKEILPVKYKAYSLAGDYISVENSNGLKELYDVNGNKVSNLNYKSVQASGNKGSYIAIDDSGFYSIITSGEIISNNYTYVSYAFDNYFIFKNQDGYYGLIDIYNGIKIEPNQYVFMIKVDGVKAILANTSEGVGDIFSSKIEKIDSIQNAVIERVNDKYTIIHSNSDSIYIDKNGKFVENTVVYKNNKLFAFKENNLWGYKDKDGKVIIEPKYDFASDLNDYGFAGVIKDGKWGVINSDGKVIKEPSFELDTYYLPVFVGEYLLEMSNSYHCIELK